MIFSNVNFENAGSFVAPGLVTSGGDGGNAGSTSLVPNLYGMYSLSDRTRIGIGITTSHGLSSEYDSDWVGRYQAIKSELLTININLTIAYQVSDDSSIDVTQKMSPKIFCHRCDFADPDVILQIFDFKDLARFIPHNAVATKQFYPSGFS